MNKKIYNLLFTKLQESLKLERYDEIRAVINKDTVLKDLPWTPKRWEKYVKDIQDNFHSIDLISWDGTLEKITDDIDFKYQSRVWGGEMWKPRTEVYRFTGWNIVKDINDLKPRAVLDVGCGFNQFKPHIPGLIGIDRFNPMADYMVEIMDFNWKPESFDAAIVFGSINFYDYDWVSERFEKVFSLLSHGSKAFCRANPFTNGTNDFWIDPYHWNFDTALQLCEDHGVELETWKQDNGDRFYFVFKKP